MCTVASPALGVLCRVVWGVEAKYQGRAFLMYTQVLNDPAVLDLKQSASAVEHQSGLTVFPSSCAALGLKGHPCSSSRLLVLDDPMKNPVPPARRVVLRITLPQLTLLPQRNRWPLRRSRIITHHQHNGKEQHPQVFFRPPI